MSSGIKKALLSSLICNILVWYDYVLFGNLVHVISDLFFPAKDRYISLVATFSVFAIGFFMRPLGASILGHIGDKYGRKIALLITIITMSLPTLIIATIPTYQSIGVYAPIALILCRLIQGFSIGGESGNATFLIEHSRDGKNRGLLGSFEVLSAVLGSAMSLTIILLCRHFTNEYFVIWGWRIPFVFGFFIGLISTYIRYITNESPAYELHKNNNNLVTHPLLELFKNYKKQLLIAISIDCVENSAFYMFMVFFAVFMHEVSHVHINFSYTIEIINIIVAGFLTIIFASLSDMFGRKIIIGGAAVMLFFISLPVFWLLCQNNYVLVLAAYFIFAIPFAASLGPSSAAMSELFPTKVRYTGFGLARNISGAIAGGLAPLICTLLIKLTGIKIIPGVYMMFWSLVGFIAILQIKDKHIHLDW